jgi:hypothetical protein
MEDGPTVRVTIAGRACKQIEVESATKLRLLTPQYLGAASGADPDTREFPASDIVISNLDDDGNIIAGETVTAVDGFTYKIPPLVLPDVDPSAGPLVKTAETLISFLRKVITPQVHWQAHTDYAEEGSVEPLESEHPNVSLEISILPDPEYAYFDVETIESDNGDGTWTEYDGSVTCMLQANVRITASHKATALMMCEQFMLMQRRSPWLIVAADPTLADATENAYPLEITQLPQQISKAGRYNVAAFMGGVRVRGIPLVPSKAIGKIYQISSLYLVSGAPDGTGAVAIEL